MTDAGTAPKVLDGTVSEASPRTVRICLYVPIAAGEAHAPIKKSKLRRLKSVARNLIDRLATRLTGRLHLTDYHFLQTENSNKGDIAIGLAVRVQLAAAFRPREVVFREIGWGNLTDAAIHELNQSCDLFVIGGGGYIFVRADGETNDRLADIAALGRINCRKIAFGIGLNRLMHEAVRSIDDVTDNTRQKIAALSALCWRLSVRDPDTQELFQRHAGRTPDLVGDPVLFMPGSRPAAPLVLGASRTPELGINLAAHGFRAIHVLKSLFPHFTAFLAGAVRQHGFRLRYFVHHELERGVVPALRDLGLAFEVVDSSPGEMLSRYATVDFVVCQMLHSCIFAASAGVAFMNIAYDRKSIAFCSMLDLPTACMSHAEASAEVLRQRFETLFQDRANIVRKIAARSAELRRTRDQFLADITSSVA